MPVTTVRERKLKRKGPRSAEGARQKAKRPKPKKNTMSMPVRAVRERKLRKVAPPSAVVYGGLCSTCDGAATCTFPRDPAKPIMHCDELDSHKADIAAVERAPRAEPVRPRAISEATQKQLDKYQGLCVNCENRESCTFPKPEGGVWHCDEYC